MTACREARTTSHSSRPRDKETPMVDGRRSRRAQRLRAVQLSIDLLPCQGNTVAQSRLSRLERVARVAPKGFPRLIWWTDNAIAAEPAPCAHNWSRNDVETSVELADLMQFDSIWHGDAPSWGTILLVAQVPPAAAPKQYLPADFAGHYLAARSFNIWRSLSARRMISCSSAVSHPSFHWRRSNVLSVSPRVAPRYGLPLSGTDARYARLPSSVALGSRESIGNLGQLPVPASASSKQCRLGVCNCALRPRSQAPSLEEATNG
jgi:hypothetical protein